MLTNDAYSDHETLYEYTELLVLSSKDGWSRRLAATDLYRYATLGKAATSDTQLATRGAWPACEFAFRSVALQSSIGGCCG